MRPTRTRTMARTGTKRAARLKRTLEQRPKSLAVEFEDLGDFDDSKEARDRRANERRWRQDHPELFARTDE